MRPAANSPAPIVRAAWIRRRSTSRRGSQISVSAQARSFCGSQPPAAAAKTSASSVASSAGISSASSAAG
ncbi:MAG: hypothetical protein ACHQJ5_12075 [Vicinamibacteria bacterium]